ncbi:hypothetical protein EQP49_06460 [Yersinia sp. 2105 StPb PI]|nr:hypothetical protein EQP49_06460 [Yersinia sp. 2105 StPb PI]
MYVKSTSISLRQAAIHQALFLTEMRCLTHLYLFFIVDLMNKSASSTTIMLRRQLMMMLFNRKYSSAQINQLTLTPCYIWINN